MIRRPPRSTILTAELRVLAEAQGFVEGGGGGEVGHGEADEEGLGHAWLRRLGCSSGGCRTARSEHPSCSTCTPDAAPLIGGAIELLKLKLPGGSEEHTSELQSPDHLVCRLLLEKKKAD